MNGSIRLLLAGALAAAAPGAAQDTLPTPAPVDVPQLEPAALTLAGADCQGVARYLNVRSASGAQLSPDGRELLYLTSTTGMPQLWVAPVRGEGPAAARQITFGANRVQFARWSPDGRWIAYGTDRGGNERTQFFLLSPDGTRERELTPSDEHFRDFAGWSPRGSRIAYVSTERNGRDFDLYLLDLAADGRPAGPARMVLRGAGNLQVEAWRPDGEAMVLSQGRGEADNDLMLLDLRTQKLDTLFAPAQMSSYRSIQWTPDGQGFFVATNHERDFAGLAHYHLPDRQLHWMQQPRWDVEQVALSPDGKFLAYTINEGGFSRLVIRDLPGQRDLGVANLPGGVVGSLEWAQAAPRLAIGVSGPGTPGDVWVYDAAAQTLSRATESTLAGLDPTGFVTPRPVQFPSFDGETIHGLLYSPPAAAGARPPVVMMLHGGPTSQARPGFDPVKQYLLARGYAVLDLNFRGSTGYGQRFTQLDNKRLRPNAVRDMQAAVEWLRALPGVDGNRVAAMGGSYGGYMTYAAVAQLPEFFRAGVPFVGVANWISGLEDASPSLKNSDRIEYGNIDDAADREFFRQISPLSYADRIRSPLMVVHGANDPRVPVAEADQIVRAVRQRGGDVEYLRFPDEGHGIAKLANRVTAYQRIARFLDRVLEHQAPACTQ
ncbi:S9 family peptidase [Longimicrobium sp.]|jgi:dipeptidyl aminopeptidase/acylaminoacyl peptidase|uniref:S9 family peptidase n=1 Tax=Longimicrobium sp. TaxID=2029185 RepID=UPI002EDB0E35